MDIVFESYAGTTGTGQLRLPAARLVARATPGGASLDVSGASLSANGAQTMAGRAAMSVPPSHLVATPISGAIGRLALDRAQLFATPGSLAPAVAVASLDLPFPTVSAHGYQEATGQAYLGSVTRLLASPFDAVGRMAVRPARVFAVESNTIERQAVLVLPMAMGATVGTGRRRYTSDLVVGGTLDAQQIMVRRALLAMGSASGAGMLNALDKASDALTFDAIAAIAWNEICALHLQLGATAIPSARMLVEVGEALALAAGGGSILDGLSAVLAALELGAAAGYVWPGSVLEAIALSGGGAAGLLALDQEQERVALSATGVATATFTMLAPESLLLADAASSVAELLDRIAEGATLLATIHLPDGQYLAWVCNTESRAFTTYRNFPFNSFCELDGHYYGATDEGIYLLEGDDDAGVPIDAHVRGGLMDMGIGKLKRMEALYLGYRASGQLLLKVVTTSDGGEKNESWYSLDAQPADAMREGRIKIGKGLKSLYWGFEIANVDGADFEIDKINWLPMALDRRI